MRRCKLTSISPSYLFMTRTFNCASCSAPLDFTGEVMQKCEHCGSTVIAPHKMFYADGRSSFTDLSSLTGRALKIAEIQRLIHAGNRVEAIKVFRESFGTGLKEAKDAVEAIERGQSIDVSPYRVQVLNVPEFQIDPVAVKRAATKVGGFMATMGVLFFVAIIGVAGVIIYFAATRRGNDAVVFTSPNQPTAPAAPGGKGMEASPLIEELKFGGEGNGDGRFKDNRHVAVDGKGRIYSSDYSPMRIQVFDAEGKFLSQWKLEAGINLYDLVVDREGNLFVANDKGVYKFEGETGKLLAKLERVSPRGLALSRDGRLVMTEGRSFTIMDASLRTIAKIDDAAERASSTFGFEKVAIDGDGVLYMTDRTARDICKFSQDGKFLNRFPHGGNSAHALAFDPAGRLYVSDTSSIKVLDSLGNRLAELPAYQAFGLTFNQAGEMFLASRPYVVKYSVELPIS